MIVIYINGEGTAEKLSPEHIYQGSNQSGVLVFAPTPPQTAMGIAFRLPDGTSTPYYPMTYQGNYEGLSQYEFTLPTSITQLAGHAAIAVQALYSDGQQNSQLIDFEIEESVVVVPPEPTPDVYTVLKQAIEQNTANILGIQGQIGNIEELAESADKKSDNAVATANQAKTTADGLADSIAQANTTAQQAVDTANESVNDIAQYKSETDSEIEQFKQDINEEVTQFENAIDSKIEVLQNTVNGQVANIESTASSAVNIANEAKSTADGLADSISQANSTASEAKEIAEEALEQSKVTGTKVNIDGEFETEVNFDSDPQGQLNGKVNKSGDTMTGNLAIKNVNSNYCTLTVENKNGTKVMLERATNDSYIVVRNAEGANMAYISIPTDTATHQTFATVQKSVQKSGDTMTGDLKAPMFVSGGFKQQDATKNYVDLVDGSGGNFGVGGIAGRIYRLNNLVNEFGQESRGYKSLSAGSDLLNERSGFYNNAYEDYTKSVVCGEGGDKFCLIWNYNNFPRIQVKVYNSSSLQIDGTLPYIESSKLEPTTANGWTTGGVLLKLPSSGVYLISINNGAPTIFIYNGQTGVYRFPYCVNIDSTVYTIAYGTTGGWSASPTLSITSIAYKKLA